MAGREKDRRSSHRNRFACSARQPSGCRTRRCKIHTGGMPFPLFRGMPRSVPDAPAAAVRARKFFAARKEFFLADFFALFASWRLMRDSTFTAKTPRTQRKREEDQLGCGSAAPYY